MPYDQLVDANGVPYGTSTNPFNVAATTQPFSSPSTQWAYAGVTGGITNTSDVALVGAGGAAVRNYLTALQYANTGIASEIVVKDGSTVIWRGYAEATTGREVTVTFSVPLRSSLNAALNVAMITTASATRVSAQGYQGA